MRSLLPFAAPVAGVLRTPSDNTTSQRTICAVPSETFSNPWRADLHTNNPRHGQCLRTNLNELNQCTQYNWHNSRATNTHNANAVNAEEPASGRGARARGRENDGRRMGIGE